MDIRLPEDSQFSKYYTKHCKYLKLKGLQPKTIEAYARTLRRIGNYFDGQLKRLWGQRKNQDVTPSASNQDVKLSRPRWFGKDYGVKA